MTLGFALYLILRSKSVVIFSASQSGDNNVKSTVVVLNSRIKEALALKIVPGRPD